MKAFHVSSLALVSLLSLCAPAGGGSTSANRTAYLAEIKKIETTLAQQKWKPARKQAKKLAATVIRSSWYDNELEAILSEIAFQQAVALANLGERQPAIWYWHIAQNLDFKIRRKDLSLYGDAGKLLREFPLRPPGKVPAGFKTYPHDRHAQGPGLPEVPPQKILTNTGATIDKPGNLMVDLVLDENGKAHHPVVLTPHLNPIVIYFVLEEMLDFPAFKPARYEGEPIDCLFDLRVRFNVSRWE